MMQKVAAAVLFAAILAGGVRVSILRLLLPPNRPPDVAGPEGGVAREPLRFTNDPTPRDIQQFAKTLLAHSKAGERVGLMMGAPHGGFSYTYWRMRYLLPERTVLVPMDILPPEDADVVAIWRTGYGDPRFDVVFADSSSAIARRRR